MYHSKECEIQEGEVCKEEIPKELCYCALKSNHGIYYRSIYDSLSENVWELNHKLQMKQ